jgi:predicted GNAT superfamily acetyltransferase
MKNRLPPLEKVQETGGKRFLFVVETSARGEDYARYERMRRDIWDDPEDHLAGGRNMVSENFFNDGGSLFIAVYEEAASGVFSREAGHMAAFAYGYVGVRDKSVGFRDPANFWFYSQYAAVRPDLQNVGLGILLKRLQGEWVRQLLGVHVITCTYDPLVGINAYRNIHVFGMHVLAYKESCYLGFTGLLNRVDVPCDRFQVAWDLNAVRPDPPPEEVDVAGLLKQEHNLIRTAPVRFRGRSGEQVIDAAVEVRTEVRAPMVLIEIPFDFYAMLQETDVADDEVRNIPVNWRETTRRAFQSQIAAGYRIVDFRYLQQGGRKRDFYVLKRSGVPPSF